MTQPATTPKNPTFINWLNAMKTCAPAIEVFSVADSYQEAYAALDRPDWLLWISLAQPNKNDGKDMDEVRRIIGVLLGYMSKEVLATIAYPKAKGVFLSAVSLVNSFCANPTLVTLQQLGLARSAVEMSFRTTVPPQGDPTHAAKSAALTVMSRLITLCLASTPAYAAEVGVELGNAWMMLEMSLGKATGTDVCDGLRTVLPFKGDYAPDGA